MLQRYTQWLAAVVLMGLMAQCIGATVTGLPVSHTTETLSTIAASSEPETVSQPVNSATSPESGKTEPEPETTAERGSKGEPEAMSAEPTGNSEPEAEVRPSAIEIVLPPFTLMVIIALGKQSGSYFI